MSVILTAHSYGLMEDLSHLGIHLDHDVLLVGHLVVSNLDQSLDPFQEIIQEYAGANVGNPLLRSLRQLELGFR